MPSNPAVLLSDELIHLLDDKAITKAYFHDLANTYYPWHVDWQGFQEIRRQLIQIEKQVRMARPECEITCIFTGIGAFWVTRDVVNEFFEHFHVPVQKLKLNGPMPIWKMTSSELFLSHISNLRQLVLAVAYDQILLNHLKDRLGSDDVLIQREFENSELSLRKLLDDIFYQASNWEFVTQEEIVLLERCWITMEMLERGETTNDQLGYSESDLHRVMHMLDLKCKELSPSYSKRLISANNQIAASLREGEGSALRRASRWEITYGILRDVPDEMKGQALVWQLEREALNGVVNSRENELGQSEVGQKALQTSMQAEELTQPTPEPATMQEPQPDFEGLESPAQKQIPSRMAFAMRNRS